MKNYALIVEYDGTAFSGWQRQDNAYTVQQALEEAMERAMGVKTHVTGAGRTDAGVHALGMVCNFRCDTPIPADRLSFVLNRELPPAVRVRDSFAVPWGFHARYHAAGKHYRYLVRIGRIPSPLLRDRVWEVPWPADPALMREAAELLKGTHDFRAFCASGFSASTTVRTLYDIRIREKDSLLVFDFYGNGFLYNMVRILTGTLIYVGQGRLTAADVEKLLRTGDRKEGGITAPACGLYMAEVFYTRRFIRILHPVPCESARGARMIPVQKSKKSQWNRVCHTQPRVFARKNGKIVILDPVKILPKNEK